MILRELPQSIFVVSDCTFFSHSGSQYFLYSLRYQPMRDVPALLKASITPKEWKLYLFNVISVFLTSSLICYRYRCKTCHFLTHAISTKPGKSSASATLQPDTTRKFDKDKDRAIAIVTNIIHHTQSTIT